MNKPKASSFNGLTVKLKNMIFKFPSRDYVFVRLSSNRNFWKMCSFVQKHNFRCLRTRFTLKNKLRTVGEETQYWHAVMRGTAKPICFSLIAGLLLYLFERNLSFLINIIWIHNTILGRFLLQPLNENSYTQMLATIAGVTGVFLALYFSVVSTVISNAYSSVSGDVRGLLLRDRINNKYVQLISFLAVLSLILLAFNACSLSPLHLAIPLLVLLSCLAVFAFVKLGLRMFILTDPTLFFGTLARELSKWFHLSTYNGYRSQDINFQTYYHEMALKSATTLAVLVKITGEKPELQDTSQSKLLNQLLALMSVYIEHRHLVPSNSRWYGEKLQHKQWYLSDGTTVGMATQTGTMVQHTNIPDTTWLEDIILRAVLEALEKDIDANDHKALYNEMVNLPDFFSGIGHQWQIDEGIKWHRQLSEQIMLKIIHEQSTDAEGERYSVGLADIFACLPMSIELGFVQAIREIDIIKLRDQLINTNWVKYDAPYHFALPPQTIQILEKTQKGVSFENEAHSANKTPSWYIAELAFHSFEQELYTEWQIITAMLTSWYDQTGKAFADTKKYKQSLSVYSRAIELSWKLNGHLEQLQKLCDSLHKDLKTDFIKKVDWNWDDERNKLDNFRKMAINGQADLIPKLWSIDKPDPDLPDFFGGAVHETGEECYQALAEQDDAEFAALFRPYFLGILGIFENVKKQVQSEEPSSASAWMSDPILDLFDISGYACIYSEYYQQPKLWNQCKAVWNDYFKGSKQFLEVLAAISSNHQIPSFRMPARTKLRIKRQMMLEQRLSQLPRKQTGGFIPYWQVDHPSELIRHIAPMNDDIPYMYVDAIDIFTVKYLMTVPSKKQLDFGIRSDKVKTINGKLWDGNV